MIIQANSRPKLKKGVKFKDFCVALGFDGEVGLSELCSRLSFTAGEPKEFAFLTALYSAFSPIQSQSTKVIVEIDGKQVISYCHAASRTEGGAKP
jgi:hypothetical protein